MLSFDHFLLPKASLHLESYRNLIRPPISSCLPSSDLLLVISSLPGSFPTNWSDIKGGPLLHASGNVSYRIYFRNSATSKSMKIAYIIYVIMPSHSDEWGRWKAYMGICHYWPMPIYALIRKRNDISHYTLNYRSYDAQAGSTNRERNSSWRTVLAVGIRFFF